MNKALWILLIVAVLGLVCFSPGCNGVYMNAPYSTLLDKTVALAGETSQRAQADQLSPAEMKQALASEYESWVKFQNARDGKK
jgi:hypothetical protein